MPKNHDALPVPTIELYARPLGRLAWSCPNCGQAHPFKAINWRRLDLFCGNCHTRYQIGIGLDTAASDNAYLMGKWNSYTANRLNPTGTPYDGAKLYGALEWQCPRCATPQQSFCPHNGQLECCSCAKPYFASVLFYRVPRVSRLKLRAPFDSIVKGLKYETTTEKA